MRALLASLALALLPAMPVQAQPAPDTRNLEITTVPPLPTARFLLDGRELTADARGIVKVALPRNNDPHRLELTTPRFDLADGSVDFVRWYGHGEADQGFVPLLTDLTMRHSRRLVAAFQSTRKVSLDFVDQAKTPVPASRITAVTLRSDSGQTHVLRGVREAQLIAVRPIQEGAGSPIGKEVRYSVLRVEIDGANAVNAGEQRIVPNRATKHTVVVLLRSVRFQVSDLLFGHPMAADVALTYPDGRAENLAVNRDGHLFVENLARGDYRIEVSAAGYSQPQEIALSRGQYVDIRVLSYVDMAVIVAVGLVVLTGLFLIGRRRLRVRNRGAP